jgi:hypothetical protein
MHPIGFAGGVWAAMAVRWVELIVFVQNSSWPTTLTALL